MALLSLPCLGFVGQRPLIKDVLGQHKMVPLEAYGIQTMSIGFIVEPEQAIVIFVAHASEVSSASFSWRPSG